VNDPHPESELELPAPKVAPALDPAFRPAALATRAFRELVRESGAPQPLVLAIEQADGSVFRTETALLPEAHPKSAVNFTFVERLVKFLLWSRGGWRLHVAGPAGLAERVRAHFRDTATGRFDSGLIGEQVFDRAIEVSACRPDEVPAERARTQALGRHLDGCRIGFDLGGSDRKVAAVQDGRVVFSDETVWDPYFQTDPQYHYDGIMDSLRRAAAHLPRVDAIGGSSAGVIVNNQIKVASLFRGVPRDVFDRRVKALFLELGRAWGVPFEVANDGEVTALAGSMSLGQNGVLGIAMGTSQAAGYVTPEGTITSWLNELAFAPVDFNPAAPRDEWSGDYGVGAQYFSQQAVGRLLAPAGIEAEPAVGLPEKLRLVQSLMARGDERASKVYQTLGVYLGHGLAHYSDFYDFRNVLILGRVTTGAGGELLVATAKDVLRAEFPELASRIAFHTPDEKDKRGGQAVAAASLPRIAR